MKPEVVPIIAAAERVARELDELIARLPWYRRIPFRWETWKMRAYDRIWWWLREHGIIRRWW
jgi:hypothetical protein